MAPVILPYRGPPPSLFGESAPFPKDRWCYRLWSAFDHQTEAQLACAFKRPMRSNLRDHPYYPWLPRTQPLRNQSPKFRVCFNLGWNDPQ